MNYNTKRQLEDYRQGLMDGFGKDANLTIKKITGNFTTAYESGLKRGKLLFEAEINSAIKELNLLETAVLTELE